MRAKIFLKCFLKVIAWSLKQHLFESEVQIYRKVWVADHGFYDNQAKFFLIPGLRLKSLKISFGAYICK